jgi:hypothetical protein
VENLSQKLNTSTSVGDVRNLGQTVLRPGRRLAVSARPRIEIVYGTPHRAQVRNETADQGDPR